MPPLQPGDDRILGDVGEIDDRGLEHAEALIHELRLRADMTRAADPRIGQALAALAGVRRLTKRGA
jgi:hypothetical protein